MTTGVRLVLALGILLGASAVAAAAPAAPGSVPAMAGPADRAPGLQAAPAPSAPPRSEGLPAPSAVTVAFIALWTLLLGLVVVLSRRDQRLAEELDGLEKQLEGASATHTQESPGS